jgi:hypothetical protein
MLDQEMPDAMHSFIMVEGLRGYLLEREQNQSGLRQFQHTLPTG